MWVENSEKIPGGEPTYEVVKDERVRDAVTKWLKAAGFEKWTSYIPTQSNKNELVIQITKFEWKKTGNTWTINLQAWVDFQVRNWVTVITQEWINKMRDNYTAIKNLSKQKLSLVSETASSLESIQNEITA